MARAIEAGELALLRSAGQKTRLKLAIHKPAGVYSARVNQSSFIDPVSQITYDGGSGTLTDVLPGMTMYVGSSAGAYDVGMVRIRKSPSATIFYIGETSEIAWADNLYLTVVDEIGLWPKHLRIVDTAVYMDYDVAYSDQHSVFDPVVVMGPPQVLTLDPNTGEAEYSPDSSDSWVFDSSITAVAWACASCADSTGTTSATPTFTFDTVGAHRVACTVTSSDGASGTGYRHVHVYDADNPPVTQFELLNCSGDFEEGGWSFDVRMYDEASQADVRDRAQVILIAEDRYGDTSGSLGPLGGYEHIVCVGWIDGETIEHNPKYSTVDFTVRGPHYWLNQIPGYPVGVEYAAAADAWTNLTGLTVDRGLWHLLHWRSTATQVMDITLTGDDSLLPAAEAPLGSLWNQLTEIGDKTILARPLCDRYGRLYCEINQQYIPDADRTSLPVVMELTGEDWRDTIDIERRPVNRVACVEIAGVSYDGAAAEPLFSRARGMTISRYGKVDSVDNLLFADQTGANELSGMIYANRNNEYPHVDIKLAANNRFFDICPRQYAQIDLAAADTPRGVTWTNKKLIPRRVEYDLDHRSGFMSAKVEFEAETSGPPGLTVIMPEPQLVGTVDWEFPGFDDWGAWPSLTPDGTFFPSTLPPEDPIPPGTGECPTNAPANGPYNWGVSGSLVSNTNYEVTIYANAIIRSSGHDNKTVYAIQGTWLKRNATTGAWEPTLEDDMYQVYAYDAAGNIVATGQHDAVTNPHYRTGTLVAPAAVEIAYVRIVLDADLLRPTAITQVVETGHPWNSGTPGVLTYGIQGASYWAKVEGAVVSGTAPASPHILNIKLGAKDEFNGQTFEVYQIIYGAYTLRTSHAIDAIQGQQRLSTLRWWETWYEDLANPVSVIQAKSFMVTINTDEINAAGIAVNFKTANGGVGDNFSFTMNNFWVARKLANYQINLQNFQLWNICPRAAI